MKQIKTENVALVIVIKFRSCPCIFRQFVVQYGCCEKGLLDWIESLHMPMCYQGEVYIGSTAKQDIFIYKNIYF